MRPQRNNALDSSDQQLVKRRGRKQMRDQRSAASVQRMFPMKAGPSVCPRLSFSPQVFSRRPFQLPSSARLSWAKLQEACQNHPLCSNPFWVCPFELRERLQLKDTEK